MASKNTTGRRRAGEIWGYGSGCKKWAKAYIARVCRRQDKIIARNRGEHRTGAKRAR